MSVKWVEVIKGVNERAYPFQSLMFAKENPDRRKSYTNTAYIGFFSDTTGIVTF